MGVSDGSSKNSESKSGYDAVWESVYNCAVYLYGAAAADDDSYGMHYVGYLDPTCASGNFGKNYAAPTSADAKFPGGGLFDVIEDARAEMGKTTYYEGGHMDDLANFREKLYDLMYAAGDDYDSAGSHSGYDASGSFSLALAGTGLFAAAK